MNRKSDHKHPGETAMPNCALISTMLILVLAGCAGDPVRVQLPQSHPADHRTPEPEFWTLPNPFSWASESAFKATPMVEPGRTESDGHHTHHLGQYPTNADQSTHRGNLHGEEGGSHPKKEHGK